MIKILVGLVLMLLAGCASVNVEYESPEGSRVAVSSTTLGKEVTDFGAVWGDVEVNLGQSKNVDTRLIACALAPELCQ